MDAKKTKEDKKMNWREDENMMAAVKTVLHREHHDPNYDERRAIYDAAKFFTVNRVVLAIAVSQAQRDPEMVRIAMQP